MSECEICGEVHTSSRAALECEADWQRQAEIDADVARWDAQVRAEQDRQVWAEDETAAIRKGER